MSVVAQSLDVPLVAYGGLDLSIVNPFVHPYTSRTSADTVSMSISTMSYLFEVHKRDNFIVIMYPITGIGVQLREGLGELLTSAGKIWTSVGFPSYNSIDGGNADSINAAAQMVKDSGYRTVVVMSENGLADLPLLADAAEKAQISNGDYFWLMLGQLGRAAYDSLPSDNYDSLTKLLTGAAYLDNVETFLVNKEEDPFLQSWKSQDAEFVREVNELYPVQDPNEPGYFQAEPDFFTTTPPVLGAGFLYDAVMAIGFGACDDRKNSTTTSRQHLDGIRNSSFHGATGLVTFHNTNATPGSRRSRGLSFGGFNLGKFESNPEE